MKSEPINNKNKKTVGQIIISKREHNQVTKFIKLSRQRKIVLDENLFHFSMTF
jgi:hypothetical protein